MNTPNQNVPSPVHEHANRSGKSNRREDADRVTMLGSKPKDIIRENEDFRAKYKGIADYVKKQGFDLFYTKGDIFLYTYGEHELEWDIKDEWKEFFQAAKNAGCTTIIAVTASFDKEFAMDYLKSKGQSKVSFTKKESLELERISHYSKMLGAFKFSWIKEGIEYSYIEEAEWLETMQQSLLDLGKSVHASLKDSGQFRRH